MALLQVYLSSDGEWCISDIVDCLLSTVSSIGWTLNSRIQARRYDVPLHAWPGTSVPRRQYHPASEVTSRLCVPRNDTSLSYVVVNLTHRAIGLFWLVVRRSGTHYLTNSEIRRVVLTALNSFLRQFCLSLLIWPAH